MSTSGIALATPSVEIARNKSTEVMILNTGSIRLAK